MCLGDKDIQNTVSAGDVFNGELVGNDWVRIMIKESNEVYAFNNTPNTSPPATQLPVIGYAGNSRA